MTTSTNLSDAELAWAKLITESDLIITYSEPKPSVEKVEPANPTMPKEWVSVAYDVTLRCGAAIETTTYRIGTGHVDFKKARDLFTRKTMPSLGVVRGFPGLTLSVDEEHALNTLAEKPHTMLRDSKLHVAIAVKCAKLLGVTPKDHEVLHALFSDARDAYFDGCTFEDWCSNTGYDSDSRKAEKVFNACRDTGAMLVRLLDRGVCAKFLELEGL